MSFLLKSCILFLIFFSLALACCCAGDDDVIYKVYDRKPTPQEGIARIRYILTKTIASIYGGALLASFIGKVVLVETMSLKITHLQAIILCFVCILFFNMIVMWIVSNFIRYFQGRQLRPLVDKLEFKILYRQWFGRKP